MYKHLTIGPSIAKPGILRFIFLLSIFQSCSSGNGKQKNCQQFRTGNFIQYYQEENRTYRFKKIGITEESIYNQECKAWYFTKGQISIEVFMTSYETVHKTIRTFLRVFSPIYSLPKDPQKQLELFQGALEANAQYMGVKLATIVEKGFVYTVAERI